tara:strand:+ start:99 stop:437 length:339 start_codon:yes stop_codon:yes gene_type:complete
VQTEFIYKILTKNEYEVFKKTDYYPGTEKDISDGFIHFSTKDQLIGTLEKYYKSEKNLILLKFPSNNLKNLKWEESGKLFFPHLYSKLNTKDLLEIHEVNNLDTKFIIPVNF